MISNIVLTSCTAFISAQGYLKEIKVPLSVYVYKTIWQNLLVFFYQSAIYIPLLIIFRINPGPIVILAIAGLLILLVNTIWVVMVVGIIAARYRDITEIINNIIRIAFFLTPIMWLPDMVGRHTELLYFNPLYHFIELIRAPLLGNAPNTLSWIVVLCITIVGWFIGLWFCMRYRYRVVYWL